LEPKYTLAYGSSGLSNAFLIAEKLGISEKVLEAAHLHEDGSGEEIAHALGTLERLKRDTEKKKAASLRSKGRA